MHDLIFKDLIPPLMIYCIRSDKCCSSFVSSRVRSSLKANSTRILLLQDVIFYVLRKRLVGQISIHPSSFNLWIFKIGSQIYGIGNMTRGIHSDHRNDIRNLDGLSIRETNYVNIVARSLPVDAVHCYFKPRFDCYTIQIHWMYELCIMSM